jgi:glutathione S-transferase
MLDGNRQATLFHAPNTRSLGALALLEELGADYRLKAPDLKAGEQRKPEFLAINPMGKVPALLHADAVATERVAIYIYLTDHYPEPGLAPAIGDPLHGPYPRWLVFYGSGFE